MNAVSSAINSLKYRIPPQVLKEVFVENVHHWRQVPVSIDEQILNKVIKSRVLSDCNLVGGIEAVISLDGCPSETIDDINVIYYIPKEKTQGRVISSVLNVNTQAFLSSLYTGGLNTTNTTMLANRMGMSVSQPPYVSTARVQLVAENTILVSETSYIFNYQSIRVILSDDEYMSNLQIRSVPSFMKLVELAVKSYIYNELIIKIDMGLIKAGQEIGRFREVVDSYSDAEQMYQDYLINTWAATAFLNDRETTNRFIKMQIGGVK
jgi:hypothetical protein